MSVSLCIASRGRYALLAQTIRTQLDAMQRTDTRIVVALDDDDPIPSDAPWIDHPQVTYSIEAREDSLGAKYNRAYAAHRADVYVLGSDDTIFPTLGWDRKIQDAADLFTDGIGLIYFGKIPGVLQPGVAVTDALCQHMGYFCTPYFPYWWQETWTDEIGHLIGRIVNIEIEAKLLLPLQGGSRGVREIPFWAAFFDETRELRRDIASRVIEASDDAPWRKHQLRQRMTDMERALAQRNASLRDPVKAKQIEQQYGFDAPEDDRYRRVKAAAVELLAGLKQRAA